MSGHPEYAALTGCMCGASWAYVTPIPEAGLFANVGLGFVIGAAMYLLIALIA